MYEPLLPSDALQRFGLTFNSPVDLQDRDADAGMESGDELQSIACIYCSKHSTQRATMHSCHTCHKSVCFECALLNPADLSGEPFRCFEHFSGGIKKFEEACKIVAKKKMQAAELMMAEALSQKKFSKRQTTVLMDLSGFLVSCNRFLFYDIVDTMLPGLQQANEFLSERARGPCLSLSQAMRLHLKTEQMKDFVLGIAEQELKNVAEPKFATQPRVRKRNAQAGSRKMAIGFLLYDTKYIHSIVRLLHDSLICLARRSEVECFIFALQKPDARDTDPLLGDLMKEYKKQFIYVSKRKDLRRKIRAKELDLVVDCICGQDGCLDPEHRPLGGHDAYATASFLNQAWPMSDRRYYDFVLLDAILQRAQPQLEAAASLVETAVLLSCWQPALAEQYAALLATDTGQRKGLRQNGGSLNCYIPMALDRVGQNFLDLLFRFAMMTPKVILCFEANPVVSGMVIREQARTFADKYGLDVDRFANERLVMLPTLSLSEHVFRLHQNMHLAINGGFYCGHTGHNAAVLAGLPTVAFQSQDGNNDFAALPGVSINHMLGLAALNIKHGTTEEQLMRLHTIASQMVSDEDLRRTVSAYLESQRTEKLHFFSDQRLGNDLLDFLNRLCTSGFEAEVAHPLLQCGTCPPAQALLEVAQDGSLRLCQLAQDSHPAISESIDHGGQLGKDADKTRCNVPIHLLSALPPPLEELSSTVLGDCTCSLHGCNCRRGSILRGSLYLGHDEVWPVGVQPHIVRWPERLRSIPPDLTVQELREATFGESAHNGEEILGRMGFCVVRKEQMRQLDLDLDDEYSNVKLIIQNMAKHSSDNFPDVVFQDPPMDGKVCPGDGNKMMTREALPIEVMQWAQRVVETVLGDGREVVQGNVIHQQAGDPHVPPHCQSEHADFQALYSGARSRREDGVDEINLGQLANPSAAPLACLQNVDSGPIRLGVYPGSHHLLIEAYQLYARHYADMLQEWQRLPDNSGKDSAAFFPIWTAYTDAHLAKLFPDIAANPIQPSCLVLEPGDVVFMLGSFQHFGTSDAGLRLFWVVVSTICRLLELGLPKDPFCFRKGSADPSQTSVVAAGLTVRLLPTPVAVPNPVYPVNIITSKLNGFLRSNSRAKIQNLTKLCLRGLNNAVDAKGYQLTTSLLQISCRQQPTAIPKSAVFGVVCKDKTGDPRVVFLEQAAHRGDHNAVVLRAAAMSLRLESRLRREGRDCIPRLQAHSSVWRSEESGGHVIFRSIVPMHGVPLPDYFKEHFEKDCNALLLTEEFRWFVQDIWKTVEDLHKADFRFVLFSFEFLAYDCRRDRVQVIQPGFGMLFSNDTFKGSTNPVLTTRQTTEAYAAEGALIAGLPSSVNAHRVQAIQSLMRDESDSAEACEGPTAGSDFESILKDAKQVDMSNAHLRSLWEVRMRGKKLAQVACTDAFLFKELNPFNPDTDNELNESTLMVSDCHQVALGLLSWFVELNTIDIGQRTKWRKTVTTALMGTVKEAEARMVKLLKIKKGEIGQPAALDRLAQHFVHALRQDTRGAFNSEPSNSAFCAFPVFSPQHERELATCGVRADLKIRAVDDEDWWTKAKECLRSAGFSEDHVAQLRHRPRQALLKNEAGKGVGVLFEGSFEKGDFVCWYVGRCKRRGCRRYSLALQTGDSSYSDGEPCRALRLERVIECGGYGAFANGRTKPSECNLEVHRKHSLIYFDREAGVELVWTPIGSKASGEGEYGAWMYEEQAGASGNRLVY